MYPSGVHDLTSGVNLLYKYKLGTLKYVPQWGTVALKKLMYGRKETTMP